MKTFDIAIVGGGASGFFAALRAAECSPGVRIIILEKSVRFLGKVRVSGGGRCNVTHNCEHQSGLIQHYPRGGNSLKKLFGAFRVQDTINWFKLRGVEMKTEADGRMFPVTNSSQTIIDCFLKEADRLKIVMQPGFTVQQIVVQEKGFVIRSAREEKVLAERVLIAAGGYAKPENYQWITALGHSLIPPVPSLFTFNSPGNNIRELAGLSVPLAQVRIESTKLQYEGPVLITHWGFSGPAVLKLSAYGADWIHSQNYNFAIQIRWVSEAREEKLREQIQSYQQAHPKRQIQGHPLFDIPLRLWQHLCRQADINGELRWTDISKKSLNKLIEGLYRDRHPVKGKTTFKEEFVTCGGIPLQELNLPSMESKIVPGLFFSGEVLNIDGITGGFNFQNAWTTGWLAGTSMAEGLEIRN